MDNPYDIEPWEWQFISNLKDKELVAWCDEEAMTMYPKYSWVYDKQLLSNSAGLTCHDLSKELPKSYPVIIKPRVNLEGLSKDCYIATSEDEIEDYDNFIAQELVQGPQFSVDFIMLNGEIKGFFAFQSHKSAYGEIKLFSSSPFFSALVQQDITRALNGYTGVGNVEYIGHKIIELHLRPSLQFYDICGGFISKMPEFIRTKVVPSFKFERTFSRVFRTRFDGHPEALKIPSKKPSTVRSVQLAWKDGKKLSETDMSLFRRRYLIINGTDINDIEEYGKQFKIKLT